MLQERSLRVYDYSASPTICGYWPLTDWDWRQLELHGAVLVTGRGGPHPETTRFAWGAIGDFELVPFSCDQVKNGEVERKMSAIATCNCFFMAPSLDSAIAWWEKVTGKPYADPRRGWDSTEVCRTGVNWIGERTGGIQRYIVDEAPMMTKLVQALILNMEKELYAVH